MPDFNPKGDLMGNFIKTQNVFSFGEVSSEFYAVHNDGGVALLENMDVLPSGGLKRRCGLKHIATISDDAILVQFKISESEKYLLVIYERAIDIYSDDIKIASVISPWHINELKQLQYAQRFNSLFFVHPLYKPVILTKDSSGFHISFFYFDVNSDLSVNIPFIRFDDMEGVGITISSSGIDNNHATFTTNVDFWTNDWVGERVLVNSKQWIIESVQSERVATAYTNGDFTFTVNPIYDWYTCAFSDKCGWPNSVSFHQNRMVFGGTKSSPNNIWMSKTGKYNNFDAGTGLDDEAVCLTLLSANHHKICTIVSGDSLQVLTSNGEWAILNSPLTPSNVSVKQHTSVGSIDTFYLPPQKIEGATVFVSQSGKDIRELDIDVLNERYNATDLCTYAKHLMNNPISMSFNQEQHKLFVVMNDGYMAVYNKYSNTEISAWATYKTDGLFKYVCVVGDTTYVVVQRGNNTYLEKFDENCLNDANQYNFSYKISAFPMIVNGHSPKNIRVRKISVRVKNTKTLFANNYRMEIPNYVYEPTSNGYTGDLSINLLGCQSNTIEPIWILSSSEQLPATILSVSVEGWYLI